jgi:cytochrome c biogenesis protein CcmG, thiol:disulfide interchange protein DsbE
MRRLVFVLVAVIAVAGCSKQEQPAPAPASASAPAPAAQPAGSPLAYEAKRLDGTAYKLADDRGKVVLLNVWATWCGPCRFEIPELQALENKYGPRGFAVVGASVDEGEPKVVQDFAAEQKITYLLVHDPEGKIAGVLDASVLPTTVLVDRQGQIVWKKIGAIMPNDRELTAAIEKALGA